MHIVPLRTSPGPGIVVYMDKTTNTGRPWGAVFLSVLLILTMGTLGQAEAGPDKKTATYKALVRNFDIIAFGNEYTAGGTTTSESGANPSVSASKVNTPNNLKPSCFSTSGI